MKICIAQTLSIKGQLIDNINNHLLHIENAVAQDADMIIFPELSITGYEPTIASELATNENDQIFDVFQAISDKDKIIICVGMPLQKSGGVQIGMIIFQPNKSRSTYAKQLLHADELPYFTNGNKPYYLQVKGIKIAFGICYETLQPTHIEQAIQSSTDIYIASVAKSQKGIEKALIYFPSVAKQYKIPILMSNCVGLCDGFIGAGQSSAWNNNGNLVHQLDDKKECILVFQLNDT